ncbi:MAG: hypothetical protein AB1696_16080 [Planctomycetota bacterium]
MIRVGFAVADITPEVGAAVPGGFAPRTSTGVLDPLQVRACVVTGAHAALTVVGVDAVSLRFDTIAKARKQIESACAIPPRNVLIATNHTHSGGPANDVLGTDSDDVYCDLIALRIAEAVKAAHSKRKAAQVAWAGGRCDGLAFNRRFKMKDGSEATHPGKTNPNKIEPAGPVDPELGITAFRNSRGKLLGVIGNFTCHSTVVGGTQFSADYSGYWQMALHDLAGSDITLVFLNGACGDITQIDHTNPNVKESGIEWAKKMADALAKETLTAINGANFTADAEVHTAHGEAHVKYRHPSPEALAEARKLLDSDAEWTSKKWQARDLVLLAEQIGSSEGTDCPVDVFRIGQAAIAAAPWQPFCEFGLKIKKASPFRPTLVATFANGMLGYVPTPQGFKGGGYEPTLCRGSKLQPDAGDAIAAETIRLLGLL